MAIGRRKFVKLALAGTAVGGASGIAGAWWTARRLPLIEEYAPPLVGLPAAFEGFRIVVLSDVHVGAHITRARVADTVRMVNSLAADLVVLAGDLADAWAGPEDIRWLALELRELRASHGVISIPGNHDYLAGFDIVQDEMGAVGLPFLKDGHRLVERSGEAIALLAVDDPQVDTFDPPQNAAVAAAAARAPRGPYPILVAHRPAAFEEAQVQGIRLTLSGHTHGGQLAIPGSRVGPVRLLTKYVRGHYQVDDAHLVVSSGVGTGWLPMRLVPSSVALVTLRGALNDPRRI